MVLDEEDESIASPGQRFLWRSVLDQQKIIKGLKKKYRAKAWGAFGGDMVELDVKDRTNQIHSKNEDVVLEMVVNTIEPVLDETERNFMVQGTYAHVGRMENILARDIECEIHPDTKKPIAHQWWIDCEGVDFMIQHHGKMGRLPWTRANALNQKSARLRLQYPKPPGIFIQAHNHQYDTSSKRFKPLVIAAPCLKIKGDFEYRIDVDDTDFGGLYFVCDKGKILEWDAMLFEPKRLTKWSSRKIRNILHKT